MEKKKNKKKKKKRDREIVDVLGRGDGSGIVLREPKDKIKLKEKKKPKKKKKKARIVPEESGRISLLSKTDKALIRNLLQNGEVAFDDENYDDDARLDFLSRPEIRNYFEHLEESVVDIDTQQARVRALALMDLSKTVNHALGIIQKALLGEYDDDKGDVVDPPTFQQVDAAKAVLSMLGVDAKSAGMLPPIKNSNVILFTKHDDYQVDKGVRIEKVRTAIEGVLAQITRSIEGSSIGEGYGVPRLPGANPEVSDEAKIIIEGKVGSNDEKPKKKKNKNGKKKRESRKD